MDHSAEQDAVERFLRRLTKGAPLTLSCKPDAPGKQSRPGGSPDYVYENPSGQRYVVEATRLIDPRVRQVEQFLKSQVCEPLASVVPGRWMLQFEMGACSENPSKQEAADWIAAAAKQCDRAVGLHALAPGVTLKCFDRAGTGVIPVIEVPELPVHLPYAGGGTLQTELARILTEATRKFAGYKGERLLLIDISQTGLDWEFHAMPSRDGPGPVLTWVQSASPSNVDEVYLDTGVRVWHPPSMRRVVTGHRFIDRATAVYVRAWPGFKTL